MYVYIQRHCSLLIVYNLKSQTEQALLQLKDRNKIYKGAKRLGRRTGKWAKRRRGERESRRNDAGVETIQDERESGRNDSDSSKSRYETSTGSDQTGYEMTKLKIKVGTKWPKRLGYEMTWVRNDGLSFCLMRTT